MSCTPYTLSPEQLQSDCPWFCMFVCSSFPVMSFLHGAKTFLRGLIQCQLGFCSGTKQQFASIFDIFIIF